tara:strand:- start:37586 stop:37852 length:267 start_codon:yes stop_codon:yes gene_type:complete
MTLRKATQATFKIAPPWVKSIAVNRNGECWGFEVVVADLERNDRRFWCALMDKRDVLLGSGFDTTKWKNSAINSLEVKARIRQQRNNV